MNLSHQTRVLIQGITEPLGNLYCERMRAYGTNVVAAVSPGASQGAISVPVFDTVQLAVAVVGGIDWTVIVVPPERVLDAAREAIAAGIRCLAIATRNVPPLETIALGRFATAADALVLGPGSGGVIVPETCLVGSHPAPFYTAGPIGLIGSGDPLDYEVALHLTEAGLGQSASVALGCDTMLASSIAPWLQWLDQDETTEAIVVLGRAGYAEELVAGTNISSAAATAAAIATPIVAYIAGAQLPPLDRPLNPDDDRENGDRDNQQVEILAAAGITIARQLSEIPERVRQVRRSRGLPRTQP